MINRGSAAVALAAALCSFSSHALAQNTQSTLGLGKGEQVEFNAAVKQFILDNPGVILEAFRKARRVAAEEKVAAQQKIIPRIREKLDNDSGNVVLGNPDGDMLLVEFFDYNCHFCKQANPTVEQLATRHPRLKAILKDVPLLGPDSVEVSRLAIAAGMQFDQKKMMILHDSLLAISGGADETKALAVIRDMGADMARLQVDAASPKVSNVLSANKSVFDELMLSGTPQFVTGDRVLVGAVGYDVLESALGDRR